MNQMQIDTLKVIAFLLNQGRGKDASDYISEHEYDLFGQNAFTFHWIGEVLVMQTPKWEAVMDIEDTILAFEMKE